MMPHTILQARALEAFIQSLGCIIDSIEMKMVEEFGVRIIVVGGKPNPIAEPNILFLPVSLQPLFITIQDQMAKDKKVDSIKKAIEKGVELDAKVRGLKPTFPLTIMQNPETDLLFLVGQGEQVEVAAKILEALGVKVVHPDRTRKMETKVGGLGGGVTLLPTPPSMVSLGIGRPSITGNTHPHVANPQEEIWESNPSFVPPAFGFQTSSDPTKRGIQVRKYPKKPR